MISQKEIRAMPLNVLKFPREVGEWQRQWFRDIIERNAPVGDIYAMLAEAYVLGMHHCMKVNQIEDRPTQSINRWTTHMADVPEEQLE